MIKALHLGGVGLLLAGLLAPGAAQATQAAADVGDDAVRVAVARLAPGAEIEWIKPAQSPMLRVVKIKGTNELAVFSADGRTMIPNTQALVDTALGVDMLGEFKAQQIVEAISQVPESQRIRYAANQSQHTLVVFMDVDCGYCKRMHALIPEFNRKGISIEYILYARTGFDSPTYRKHVAVMCAEDRHRALDAAMAGATMDTSSSCNSAISEMQNAGAASGLQGTPMVAMTDGSQIGGYVTPDQALSTIGYRLSLQKAIGRRP